MDWSEVQGNHILWVRSAGSDNAECHALVTNTNARGKPWLATVGDESVRHPSLARAKLWCETTAKLKGYS